ncbi:hypothetical protein GGR89_003902 [Sphingomonas trueperi]|uniref:Uncharacterized protein n=1 Tax=Sphingomonas trueperi TaxID=53317 RepID=A0A7X6BED0_9SPHN|nr:hypothetical protein [Sphingomonas trueperi]
MGLCLDRDQQTFWNPSTPNPSSKEEGLKIWTYFNRSVWYRVPSLRK